MFLIQRSGLAKVFPISFSASFVNKTDYTVFVHLKTGAA